MGSRIWAIVINMSASYRRVASSIGPVTVYLADRPTDPTV